MDTRDEVLDERPRPWGWFDHEIIDIYAAKMGPLALSVYIALLRFCDCHTMTCYPSYETLQQRLGMSRQSIWRSIQKLVELKLISLEHRSTRNGRQATIYTIQRTPNTLVINYEAKVPSGNLAKVSKEKLSSSQELPLSSPQELTQSSLRELELESVKKNKNTPPTPKTRKGGKKGPDEQPKFNPEGFSKFYAAYPKHLNKQDAMKAWDDLQPNPDLQATILLHVTARARDDPQWLKNQRQFVPGPGVFLRNSRWLDEWIPKRSTRERGFVE